MIETLKNTEILTQQPVPEISAKQMQAFTLDSLLARNSGRFDFNEIVEKLKLERAKEILAIDIGGTAMKGSVIWIKPDGKIEIDKSRNKTIRKIGTGANYLTALLELASEYPDLPAGVCSAGVVQNNKLLTCPNAPGLVKPLAEAGNFSGIFKRTVPLMNDAEAVVLAGAISVFKRDQRKRPTIGYIWSTGIGGAAIDAFGNRISLEPGHVVVADSALNPNNIVTPCKLFPDWNHVCLEKIAASGAGIEVYWEEKTGKKMSGEQIAGEMYNGNKRALKLYSISALISAHIIEGIRSTLNFPIEETAVVLSGAAFKTHGMVGRIRQIMDKNNTLPELILASDLKLVNAGMAGVAISALMADSA